ncbi:chromosome segregation protein SMC [Solicola gregarius]|uniref:Chromosome partition protein Smc n=1 Tax=Solicola gregarius TaxID=2908642 RepID=A0AA46YKY3_9ACTN|nr:chromosome segregation protein SMC [Solicola gregarius]UYM04363.1 chromosome segregation protein SMC [Solicola gregarius]
MYLKSLTLRGFKSFASSTTLQLEPGITCVVGPNGSGKSNVVDALSWVMGEQGVKSLRGGKMEDVIFAGTSGRPPLGRAEVVLTIDNGDGALPIDYTEVTIARTMFRNGGSEYAINGQSCRLLDVQELLSDSGIGREMHVIVGQGQLDSILRATPEERRGFIEEAAGVLKHRKRKEKALRKLDATEGNLTRLGDLLSEIRRQLKPLGRQAEVARKAAVIQADVRDARARLLADEVVAAREELKSELADETAIKERRAAAEKALTATRNDEGALEDQLRADAPRLQAAQDTWYSLSGLRERFRGTASLATERVRRAADDAEDLPEGRDPEQMETEAAQIREQENAIAQEVSAAGAALEDAIERRTTAEEAYTTEERRIAGLVRAAADRREGLARLHGQVNAAKSRARAAEEEIGRITQSRAEAASRAEVAEHDFAALETQVAGLDAGESGLDAEHDSAQSEFDQLTSELTDVRDRAQVAERDRAALAARKEALELGLTRKDGTDALLAAAERVGGIGGSVAATVSVRHGYETAVASALGPVADAVVADGPATAARAIAELKRSDSGRAGLLLGGAAAPRSDWPALPGGATYAIDALEAPEALLPALRDALSQVAVVDDLDAARSLVESAPDVVAVTRDGDLLGRHFAAGGSSSTPSLLEVQAAVDEAAEQLTDAGHTVERLTFEVSRLTDRQGEAQRRVDVALARLHESDAAMAAVAEKLGQFGSTARAAREEADRLDRSIADAQQNRDEHVRTLATLEERLSDAQQAPDEEPDTTELESLAEQAKGARGAETEGRLALRTAEERARALHGRADSLLAAAQAQREAQARAEQRRRQRIREAEVARAVLVATDDALGRLDRSIDAAANARAEVQHARSVREEQLAGIRTRLRELTTELERLTDSVHRDEIARAEQRLRIEALEQRSIDELGLDVEALIGEYGPEVPIPVHPEGEATEAADGDESAEDPATDDTEPVVETMPFDREQQRKRLRSAERAMAQLGKVNPLALEEFSALEERHKFLTEQLEDLRKTRKDLLDIVADVDTRVEQVFTDAWYDTAAAFEGVFSRLFPGGEGKLVLTDPSDMLTTGIDVEARPAGKKVKRLSLLSGGERSLVAVAFLVSLFKARPSPFYILDEVEAALDDVNLGRLLEIYEELRENSQLVVITHQKRTMEVADALYGVSMRGDGVSAVISQRIREAQAAS